MPTFGPLLRRTREERGVSLEAVAQETRLSKRYLIALEEETIGKLPGGTYNRAYLRMYARFLSLEPESLLRDYGELEARLIRTAEEDQLAAMNRALEQRGALTGKASGRRGSAPGLAPSLTVAAVVLGGMAAAGGAVWVAVAGLDAVSAPEVEVVQVAEPVPDPEPLTSSTVLSAAPQTGEIGPGPAPQVKVTTSPALADEQAPFDVPVAPTGEEGAGEVTAAKSVRLSVAGSGVGTSVVDQQLRGQADRFSAGSTVVFWTHVRGGRTGDTIDHVWFHDGTLIGAASLSVRGSDWRTQSRRLLAPGGLWTVEARDPEGHVLARHEIRTSDE